MLPRGMLCIYTVYERIRQLFQNVLRTAKKDVHAHKVAGCFCTVDWRGKYRLDYLKSDGYIGSQKTYSCVYGEVDLFNS